MPVGKSWKDYLWWRLRAARPVGQLLWWNGLHPFQVLLVSQGSAKTPTKTGNPGASKLTPGSGKKTQPIQQAAGMFWGDKKKREKEDADAQAQEEKRRKKPSGPILSLDEHEHSITELTNQATPSRSTQPSKTSSSAPKDRVRPRKDPVAVPDPSDDEPVGSS